MRLLVTAIENLVLFGTLAAGLSFALAALARQLSTRRIWRPHPHRLAKVYAAAVALPPVVSSWIVGAAFLPEGWLGKVEFDLEHATPVEHLHLLSDVTSALEPGLAIATAILGAAVVTAATLAAVRGYRRVGRVIGGLDLSAEPPPVDKVALVDATARKYGLDVGLILGAYPVSFVWGFARSKLVLSSGLLRTLSSEELEGVLEHEAAHHVRRDNAVKLALSLAAHATLLFPVARRILAWRSEAVELVCDEIAAARTRAPLDIAGALVKVRRLTLSSGQVKLGNLCASELLPTPSESFDFRVRRLVGLADALPTLAFARPLERSPTRGVALAASVFAVTLASALAVAPLAVHRAVESAIHFLS